MIPFKFEDLVAVLTSARSEFDLARLPLDKVQQGVTDLQTRLQALELAVKSQPAAKAGA